MENQIRILLVEDDLLTQKTSRKILSRYGEVMLASSFNEALSAMRSQTFDIGFFDLNLQGNLDGLELISMANAIKLYAIVVSGEPREIVLEKALRNGAQDFLSKPFSDEKLDQVLGRFFNNRKHLIFEEIINKSFITKSHKQLEELWKIKNLPISNKPVFIHGETGTGKRVVAHIVREIMGNRNFIELNCSQYSDDLISSELFGHVKGAFTGASSDKEGLLFKANGGIVFLDEIHALSLKAQKTLLKAVEEKEFYPVGSTRPVKSNFRLFSATCENIQRLMEAGKFRTDLFARLSTFQIHLLPLRERIEDIDLLLEHFISKHLVQICITEEAKGLLRNYSWPRNTREIEDLVENWIVEGKRLISPDVLPSHIKNNTPTMGKFVPDLYLDMVEEYGLNDFMTYLKKEIVGELVKRNENSIRKAASSMGSSYSNLAAFLRQNKDLNLSQGKRI
ncbi:MAG: sigma-54-dependent transcriptional regulator [Bacteriovoracia bacterium]